MTRAILRGDLYYVDLSPVVGSEQGGVRPVLVIQNDMGNKFSPTVIVAAVTSRAAEKPKLPTHLYLIGADGLEKESIVLLEQIRTIDKTRLRGYIGRLDETTMKGIDRALGISVGLG